MKIAVLASGLKRNYQYTVKYLHKNLIKDMDVFVLLDISIEKSLMKSVTTPGRECPFYHGETRTDEEYLTQLFGDKLKVLEFINSDTNLEYKEAIQNYIKKVKDNIRGADLSGKLRYHLDYGEDRIAEYPLKQFYNQLLLYNKFQKYVKNYGVKYDYILRLRLDRIKPISRIMIGNAIQNTSADIWTDIVRINKKIWWARDCLFFVKPAIYGILLKEFLDKYGSYRDHYKDQFECNFLCIPEYNFGNLLYMLSRRGVSIKRFHLNISEIKQDCDNTNCENCTHYDLLDIKSIHNFH